jgi:chromosome segregation ATPase
MKIERLLLAVIFGLMPLIGRAWAQDEQGYISPATTALQEVLSNLKQSVEKLSLDNDQMGARDNAIKQQISQLQEQLSRLEAQADLLNKEIDKLKDKNPRRAQQIARLEEKNSELDDRAQKTQDSIKLIQQSLQADARQKPKTPSFQSLSEEHSQKERLKLMKMIYDSQQRQEALHKAISEYQKNTPLQPAASALEHQQFLKEQIKDMEAQIAAYPPQNISANGGLIDQGDDPQLRQLELELKALEQNYLQLKDLMGQMDKKAQSVQLSVSEHIEGQKLQSSIDDLNRQGVALKVELEDLRSQMVDLDKRKSSLETMIKQLL